MTVTAPVRLSELLALHPLSEAAWTAAWAAGRFLRDERPENLDVDTKSSPTDAVTVMDRTAEAMIIRALLENRPSDGVLGEEGGSRESTSGVRWIIDPLDGTVNYLYGLPVWGVSIAAEVDGTVSLGVVVLPELDVAYLGIAGRGSWEVRCDTGVRLRASDGHVLSSALVSTGFGYDADRRRAQGAVVARLLPQVRDIRRSGCAVADLCWLARGGADGHFERGLNPWDFAAAGLVASEAGAIVRGLHADADLTELLIAAVPGIVDDLVAALAELEADRD